MKKGWEYKKLGEVGTFVRGGNFSKKDFVENGFPCIHYGQIHMKFGIETFKHISSVPSEMVKPDRCARKGDLVIAITSEDDAGSCKCTAWMGDYDAYVGGHTAIYRHTMQPKYVSYYFMSPFFQKDKLEYTHGFKVVEISPKDIAKISIPVPPLSEQQSIVDYLDSAFAKIDAMKANADKALDEAKALFQASLKEMLEPKEGWEECKIGDICNLSQGLAINAHTKHLLIQSSNLPLLRIKDMKDGTREIFVDEKNCPQGCIANEDEIIYTRTGTLGLVFTGMRGVLHNNCFKIMHNTNIIDKNYLIYFLQNNKFKQTIIGLASRAAQPDITHKLFKAQMIHFPHLSTQQTIATSLDSLKSKVDRLQENYEKISQECDALKQALLRQVFE